MTPAQAVQHGIALLPADRQHAGSVGSLTVADNVTLQVLHHYITNLVLNRRRMVREAQTLLGEYDVRPNDPTMTFQALSGGNQQKVLLAKWLCTTPALLLLHEATQGVDVGARQQIYTLIVQAARKGTAVLCASSDYEQLATICDRVLIFGRGRIMRELVGKEITKERIAEQCYNSVTTSALTGSMREGA
jgi:ribose transport system ATP-binding protein